VTDIEPWVEGDAPAEMAEWLGAARRERPRDDIVGRCAILVAAGGVGLVAAAAKPIAGGSGLFGSSTAALTLLKWGAGGVLAGTLFATGAYVAGLASAPSVRSAPPHPKSESVEAPRVRGPVLSAPAPRDVEPEPDTPDESAPAPVGTETLPAKPTTDSPRSKASPDERLAEELALIDRVRASVDASNPALASTLLAEHGRRFGKSAQFAPEARYLRLEVMVATGRNEEARRLAHEILERDPSGPHAAQARALLKESDPERELRR